MDFTIQTKIDKDFVLSKVSEEDIFCHYLGISEVTKKLYVSKVRSDKHPTCGFYRGKSGTLYFHDFATGDCFSCFSLVMALYDCSYYRALRIVASDFGLITESVSKTKVAVKNTPKFTDTGPTLIQVKVQDFDEKELKWWNDYGITEDILKKFRVYSCKHVFLNGNLFAESKPGNLIFGYFGGKKDGIELWRIYFPKRKSYRFINNWNANKIQGYEQLPKEGKALVITKSMKDVMTFYSLGIPAIAPCSENLFISDNMLQDLKRRFTNIFVMYDNDLPGIHNLISIKKKYPELNYVWLPRSYKSKDLSDYYKANGREKTINLIKNFLEQWRSRIQKLSQKK